MDHPEAIETRSRNRRAAHGCPIAPTPDFVRFELDAIEQSIPERFEQQVAAHPDGLAVKTERFSLSYTALNRWANRVAHAVINARGTGPSPIALLLAKDAPQIAAILGVLKAGKIYVPLSASYPLARNQLILEDAQIPLIVTDDANLATARQLGGETVAVLNIDALASHLDDTDPRLAIAPDAYAYIIYTSGSTGRPKGIVAAHRTLLHSIMNFTNEHYITHNDHIMGLHSFAFAGSLKDIFGSLLNGGTLFPLEIEQVGFHKLARWLVQEEITIFNSVTSSFRHFARSLTGGESFPRLRMIRIGSEEVTWKDVELFKACFPPDCVLVNHYGATETGVTVREYMIDHQTPAIGRAVPIGYPCAGMEVLMLDDAGEPIGFDQVGQIAVRSAFLPAGYWRQPELTRKAYLPDPEGGERRIYLTGDLGVMEPDGCLTHVGRKDFQVKVRGSRVEMAEIEAVLQEAPGVEEAVVVARADLPEDRFLVAYIVPRTGQAPPPPTRALRTFLRDRLPEAAIPSAFVLIEALPLTPSGKVDRKGLPAPNTDPFTSARKFVAPRTELEERLAELWEEILGIRPIGVLDDFFEMGGHSLLGARLIEGIRKSFGKSLPFGTLISAPTIERLAAILADASGTPSRPLVTALRSGGTRPPFFCIPGTGGHALSLYDLARLGDPDQPFFVLEFPGEHGPRRVEDMAAVLLAEVRKIQPAGPYRLGGYSFGGALAFELAQQLLALGHEVSQLVLIDTWGKGYLDLLPLHGRIRNLLQKLGTWSFSEKLSYASQKAASLVRKIGQEREGTAVETPSRENSPESAETASSVEINSRAWLEYVPRVYPGRLILLRAEQQPDWVGYRCNDPSLGWKPLAAQGVEIHPIPGDHRTLLDKPNIRILAETLSACLRQ